MYQIMWSLCAESGHFRSILHVPTKFGQDRPERFVQNELIMFSQCTELGKLKTHGKYIVSTWQKFSIF